MIKNLQINTLKCTCVPNPASNRVVYMIYPRMANLSDAWLQLQARKTNCSIVIIYVPAQDWDNDLTPWPAPGEPKGSDPFKGLAAEFYQTLISKVIPEAENALALKNVDERDLIGVSLSGLFTLWQWMQFDTFRSIASLSGSFWYHGFLDWFRSHPVPQKNGTAYFLLGTEEPKAKVAAFRSVGVNTEAIVAHLKSAGISVKFEWVPGDHFANPAERAEKALAALS